MKARRIISAVGVALAALLVAGPAVADQSDHGDDRHRDRDRCAGTWSVGISPLGTYGIFVFNEDHTMTSTTSNFSGLTSGSGVWEETRDGRCAAMFEGFTDNDLDGAFDARFNLRLTLRVHRNRIKGTGTFDILDLDGTFAFNALTGLVLEGQRMKLIRE